MVFPLASFPLAVGRVCASAKTSPFRRPRWSWLTTSWPSHGPSPPPISICPVAAPPCGVLLACRCASQSWNLREGSEAFSVSYTGYPYGKGGYGKGNYHGSCCGMVHTVPAS